jgi:predicted methyltransferase
MRYDARAETNKEFLMKVMKLTIIASASLLLAACGQKEETASTESPKADTPPVATAPAAAPAPEQTVSSGFESRLQSVLSMAHRSAAHTARDRYRHGAETLTFFGMKESDTVIEITPGSGYFAEILAPVLRDQGQYIAVLNDPAKAASDRAKEYFAKQNTEFDAKLKAAPEVYGKTTVMLIDPKAPSFGAPASADMVLTFRNVHNWVGNGTDKAMFKAFFDVLKPGGKLGLKEHRATPGTKSETDKDSGYMTEAAVIALATEAGFTLQAKSEINANALDTKDHPEGVWTLPPSLALGDKDREKYIAIGESDRMTMVFVKPALGK